MKHDFIYNALPYLYTAGGVITLLTAKEMIGSISGVLLISAAMLVFHMRIEYRTRHAAAAELNQSKQPLMAAARSSAG